MTTEKHVNFNLDFAYANGEPVDCLAFRSQPEDFIVEELFDETFSGDGEHFWLKIQKRGENTQWIADKLAIYFSVKSSDVGFAGMKDRHAVTSQWFSVYLPGKVHTIDWPAFIAQSQVQAQLLASASHSKKLRRGDHTGNRFVISLRGRYDQQAMHARLQTIAQQGVPNYFGEQRFGRELSNLHAVADWFAGGRPIRNRNKKSLALSAARSYLFNQVLSTRVASGNWVDVLTGDSDASHASGPMWGRGRALVSGETEAIEAPILADFATWCERLEHSGLNQERRSLSLRVDGFSWQLGEQQLILSLTLAPGQFATSVLREICKLDNRAHVGGDR